MLRANAALVGRTPRFTIYDEDDALAVIKRAHGAPPRVAEGLDAARHLLRDLRRAQRARDARGVRDARADAARQGRRAGLLRPRGRVPRGERRRFRRPARASGAAAARSTRTCASATSARFRVMLVDEYQDTNRAQYEFVRLLGARHGNVRGRRRRRPVDLRLARRRHAQHPRLRARYPAAKVVRLEENYRSTPQVLALANAVISANEAGAARCCARRGRTASRWRWSAALDERDEAEYVAAEIEQRREPRSSEPLGATSRCSTARTRRAACSRKSLRRRAIPYRLVGRRALLRPPRDQGSPRVAASSSRIPPTTRRSAAPIAAPRRGIGETTRRRARLAARRSRHPLLAGGAPRGSHDRRCASRRATALAEFAALVERLRADGARNRASTG